MAIPPIAIPAFSHFYNLVVFPAPNENSCQSSFFLLKNNVDVPKPNGKVLWVEYVPDSIYCLLPSSESSHGEVTLYSKMPDFLNNFVYCLEINQLSIGYSDSADTPVKIFKADETLSRKERYKCQKCFISHFPKPNTKLCKFKISRNDVLNSRLENSWRPRLRGGADNDEGDKRTSSMVDIAIKNAAGHGISLHQTSLMEIACLSPLQII